LPYGAIANDNLGRIEPVSPKPFTY
jgi:hypothetical protein